MRMSLHQGLSRLADASPLAVARLKRLVQGGPSFRRAGKLWLIEDRTGRIFVPSIRRYGMYTGSVRRRIDYMLERYVLGDLTDALVIDVGAHVGEFAMAVAPRARRVISFEPDPIARAALLENTRPLSNVTVMPIALSNENKTTRFYVATEHADSSLFEPERYTEVIDVDARRLDSLGIDTSDCASVVLKMDAEGFEPEVLQGGGEWLRKLSVACIDVAPERAGSDTYGEVKALLEAAGMREITLTPDQVLVMRRR